MLENEKDTDIRRIFETYNGKSALIEAGQSDIFEGLLSKTELLQKILNYYGQQEKGVEQARSVTAIDKRGDISGEQYASDTDRQSAGEQQSDARAREESGRRNGKLIEENKSISLPEQQTINESENEKLSENINNISDNEDDKLIDNIQELSEKDNITIDEVAQKEKYNGNIVELANNIVKNTEIKKEGEKVNPSPTEGQKEAGNYKKGHVNVQGFDITIENPKGSERSGIDADGKPWIVNMQNHYGYFKRSEGKDGDQIVFIGESRKQKLYLLIR